VWALRVDVHVLDAGGNLLDAAFLAALAALLAFRKPEVEVRGRAGELRVTKKGSVGRSRTGG
jgi:exosome complex RNA-binding protein Rrp42 (RNase PH superfamily)